MKTKNLKVSNNVELYSHLHNLKFYRTGAITSGSIFAGGTSIATYTCLNISDTSSRIFMAAVGFLSLVGAILFAKEAVSFQKEINKTKEKIKER